MEEVCQSTNTTAYSYTGENLAGTQVVESGYQPITVGGGRKRNSKRRTRRRSRSRMRKGRRAGLVPG